MVLLPIGILSTWLTNRLLMRRLLESIKEALQPCPLRPYRDERVRESYSDLQQLTSL
jgi:hypothetical protein